MKFSDTIIASTASEHEELCFWEPRTLAPYEPLLEKKFVAAPNTLQVGSSSYIIASHAQKTTLSVWRWDKKEPVLRFPLKDPPSCLRLGNNLCVAGAKGRISLWEPLTGSLLGEIEGAHYLDITDMELT